MIRKTVCIFMPILVKLPVSAKIIIYNEVESKNIRNIFPNEKIIETWNIKNVWYLIILIMKPIRELEVPCLFLVNVVGIMIYISKSILRIELRNITKMLYIVISSFIFDLKLRRQRSSDFSQWNTLQFIMNIFMSWSNA